MVGAYPSGGLHLRVGGPGRETAPVPTALTMDRENRRGVEGHPLDSRRLKTEGSTVAGGSPEYPARWSPKAATDKWRAGIKPGRRFSRSVFVPQPGGPAGNWQEGVAPQPVGEGAPGRDCREQAVPGLLAQERLDG